MFVNDVNPRRPKSPSIATLANLLRPRKLANVTPCSSRSKAPLTLKGLSSECSSCQSRHTWTHSQEVVKAPEVSSTQTPPAVTKGGIAGVSVTSRGISA